MRVAVEGHRHRVPQERFLEPARSEEREDLGGLALDRVANRRVVQDGHAPLRPEAREGRLELQRLGHRLVDEPLDHVLAPRLERALAEATAEPLTPAKPTPWISHASPSRT